MYNMYRPTWCDDVECPEGNKEPKEVTKERKEALDAVLGRLNLSESIEE